MRSHEVSPATMREIKLSRERVDAAIKDYWETINTLIYDAVEPGDSISCTSVIDVDLPPPSPADESQA